MFTRLWAACGLFLSLLVSAQNQPFNLSLKPLNISGLGGVQAYAFGQHHGKWLIVGGRLDGLHRRQPFATFDPSGNNQQLVVIDPIAKQTWSASISSLSTTLKEQLSSTNMQFHQEGQMLYIIGGYGYNTISATKMTFNYLTAIDLPAVVNAIVAGTFVSQGFRQISDPAFAVTGGHLEKINNTYYLLGGNKFDGNYNPMGNPTYTQVYTDAIRRFIINDNGSNLSVTHLSSYNDAANLHRRDYNAVPQILPDLSEGITMFSGVFQPTIDLPFLNCVTVDSLSYTVNNAFQQYYNHYHCAVLPLYSEQHKQMHSVFFGGIAQFYDSAGVLVQDLNVPFVKTIARVSRDSSGQMTEHKLPVEMPGLLGASSEFITNLSLPHFKNGVIKLDSLNNDSTLMGYVYGGISSTAPNIFFTNTGNESIASSQIFEVYLRRNTLTATQELSKPVSPNLSLQVFPNPSSEYFTLRFRLLHATTVKITVYDLQGKALFSKELGYLAPGDHDNTVLLNNSLPGSSYLVELVTNNERVRQKVVCER